MQAHEIHSIRFSRDAVVLFLEGPEIHEYSWLLQPVTGFPDNVNTCPTFRVEPWMFQT